MPTVELFWQFVQYFGAPITFLIIALYAFYSGRVVTKAQQDATIKIMNDNYVNMLSEKNNQYKEMLAVKTAQIKEAKDGEAEMWSLVKPTLVVTNAALSGAQSKVTTP